MEALVNLSNSTFNLLNQLFKDEMESLVYMDTTLLCGNGQILRLPKLLVGILFPELESCEHFQLFVDNTILLPDFTDEQIRDGITKILQSFEDHTKHASDKDIIKPLNERLQLEDVQVAATEEPNQTFDIHLDPIELQHIKPSKKQKRKSYKGEIYPGEYPYKCSYCDKKFKQVGHVNHHERSHTENYKYECVECGKKFYQKSHLKEHINVHTGRKPLQCHLCNKTFSSRSGLKAHNLVHAGRKDFSCDKCETSFTQASNLKTHMRLHTGDRRFMCSQCGICFNTKLNLQRHQCKVEMISKNSDYTVTLQSERGDDQETLYLDHNLIPAPQSLLLE